MSFFTVVVRSVFFGGVLFFWGSADAAVVYVDSSATGAGNGAVWGDAYTTIQAGIDGASDGDDLWVAQGTYSEAITLVTGVGVFGGFVGTETSLGQSDFESNVTTIDATGLTTSTVTMDAVTSTVLSGFTITGGDAVDGGGAFVDGADNTNVIEYCTITGNSASNNGGGLYIKSSTVQLVYSTISSNTASNDGGGIKLYFSSLEIDYCIISGNDAGASAGDIGGGIDLQISSPLISNTTISDNTAANGAGLSLASNTSPTITNTIISGNTAASGRGGVSFAGATTATFTDCTISNNMALTTEGGGIYMYLAGANPTFTNCIISNNAAPAGTGGGIEIGSGANPLFENCTISGNTATQGAGIKISSTDATFNNCIISGNEADNYAGGLYSSGATPNLMNCTVADNTVGIYGGGVYITGSSIPIVTNCIFYGNTGYAIYESGVDSDPVLSYCLFEQNGTADYYDKDSAAAYTGGANINAIADGNATNNLDGSPLFSTGATSDWTAVPSYDVGTDTTTLTDNTATFVEGALVGLHINVESIIRLQSLIVANTSTTLTVIGDVTGIVAVDNKTYELIDYHLEAGSAGIDAGTSAGAPLEDIDGDLRDDGLIDIGVDEFIVPAIDDVWVDFAWAGTESGTLAEPYSAFATALSSVAVSGTIHINGGSATTNTIWIGTLDTALTLETYDGAARIGE